MQYSGKLDNEIAQSVKGTVKTATSSNDPWNRTGTDERPVDLVSKRFNEAQFRVDPCHEHCERRRKRDQTFRCGGMALTRWSIVVANRGRGSMNLRSGRERRANVAEAAAARTLRWRCRCYWAEPATRTVMATRAALAQSARQTCQTKSSVITEPCLRKPSRMHRCRRFHIRCNKILSRIKSRV